MASAFFEAVSGKESIVCAVIPCSPIKIFLRVWGTCFLASSSWEEVCVRGTCMGVFTYVLQKRACVCVCVCVCVILPGGRFALGRNFVPCQPFSKINP